MNLRLPRRATASTSDSPAFAYLGEEPDLTTLRGGEIAVVLGKMVIMNLDEPPRDGTNTYVPQPTRESRRKDLSVAALRQQPSNLYSSIHSVLARHIETHDHRTRFVLAADAMIALAAQQKRTETLLICNGYEAVHHTYFDTYLFRHGQLMRITEAIIKETTHLRYANDVKQQLDEALADYPDARILWVAPLSPLSLPGYKLELVGPEIYAGRFPVVTHDGQTTPPSPKLPAIATAATIIACLGVGAVDVASLSQKRATYDALTQQIPGSTPTVALEVLQARAAWQRDADANTAEVILSPANHLLAAIAQNPDWRITSLSFSTQRGAETAPTNISPSADTAPLSVTLSTPLVANLPLMDQAQPIVAALTQHIGRKLVIKQQGISTAAQDGRLYVTIDAENK